MGFKTGEGLGKSGQGRTEPIPLSTQRGRAGLGHHASAVSDFIGFAFHFYFFFPCLKSKVFSSAHLIYFLSEHVSSRSPPISLKVYFQFQQLGRDWDVTWDSSDETKNVEETVMWLSCSKSIRSRLHEELNDDWIVEGEVRRGFV